MKIVKSIILVIAIAINLNANALSVDNGNGGQAYKISVANGDTGATNSGQVVRLTFYEFNSHFNYIGNSQVVNLPMSYGEQKDVQTNMPAKMSYFSIMYYRTVASRTFFNYLYVYPIYASDDVHCEIFEDSVRFSGKGSQKMNVQAKLFEMILPPKESVLVAPPFNIYIKQRVEIYLRQLAYLESQKSTLSADEYNYFKDQCYGLRNWHILAELRYRVGYSKKDKSFNTKDVLVWLNNQDVGSVRFNKLVATYLMDYLYQKEKFTASLEVSSEDLPSQLFKRISEKYIGDTQYHLKMLILTEVNKMKGDVLKEFRSMGTSIKNEQYKDIFTRYLSSLNVGNKAYEFALPDIGGNIRKLSDFRGKVVVMDFWFTGCIPCMNLAKQMKLVMEDLKGLDVVFITANTDWDQDKWKRSVKEGSYTHEGTVDLFLGGFNTPILKHYNIASFPRLIIIDREGRVITSTPKKPIDDLSRSEFISIIRKAL